MGVCVSYMGSRTHALSLSHTHTITLFSLSLRRRFTDMAPGAAIKKKRGSLLSTPITSDPSSDPSSSSTPSSSSPSMNPNKKRKAAKKSRLQKEFAKEMNEKTKKYQETGNYDMFGKAEINKTTNISLKKEMKLSDKFRAHALANAARAEILLPAQSGVIQLNDEKDKTWRLSQKTIADNVDERTRRKMFDLSLPTFGPYHHAYTRNGKHLLLAGAKGHLSLMNWSNFSLVSELHVKETVRDACFLHNETMYAVAQKKYVYIYDQT